MPRSSDVAVHSDAVSLFGRSGPHIRVRAFRRTCGSAAQTYVFTYVRAFANARGNAAQGFAAIRGDDLIPRHHHRPPLRETALHVDRGVDHFADAVGVEQRLVEVMGVAVIAEIQTKNVEPRLQ